METDKQQMQGPSLDIKPEVATGTYSNLAIITHSASEFIFDFASLLPGFPRPQVNSRIIMTPEHAKRLLQALNENVTKYESIFGPIQAPAPQQQRGATFDLGSLAEFGGKGNKS